MSLVDSIYGRYIKPSCMKNGRFSPEAFGLRPGPPKEDYLSVYRAKGNSDDVRFECALHHLSATGFVVKETGFFGLINADLALASVNTGKEPVIELRNEGGEHYGVYFLTDNKNEIFSAQDVLSLLATQRYKKVSDIKARLTGQDKKKITEKL